VSLCELLTRAAERVRERFRRTLYRGRTSPYGHQRHHQSEIYAGLLSAMIWDKVKSAHARLQSGRSKASLWVRKEGEDGRTLKEVIVVTSDPEIIKDMIRQADE
jgi:hypothetical protein